MKQSLIKNINSEKSVVIIGSGMGGGTLAVLLARAGYQPVIIEAGDQSECSISDIANSGRSFALAKNRAIEIGGSTNLWHGVTAPLDDVDFMSGNSGRHPGWPIERGIMLPYWTAAAAFLGFS
ncbi:MAG: NAD(P)-binding protein, partial [Limnohabitans sp.]